MIVTASKRVSVGFGAPPSAAAATSACRHVVSSAAHLAARGQPGSEVALTRIRAFSDPHRAFDGVPGDASAKFVALVTADFPWVAWRTRSDRRSRRGRAALCSASRCAALPSRIWKSCSSASSTGTSLPPALIWPCHLPATADRHHPQVDIAHARGADFLLRARRCPSARRDTSRPCDSRVRRRACPASTRESSAAA